MSICYNYAENSERLLFYRISIFQLLGAFAKSREATIIFLMSFRPHGTTQLPLDGLNEIWYLSIFRKSVEKVQVYLKCDKNNGYFTWRPLYIFFIISRSVLLRIRSVSDKTVEKIKTHIFSPVTSPPPEKHAVYEIWKSTVEPDRPEKTIWGMRIVSWIPKAINTHSQYKAINTHSQYVILIASPLHAPSSMLRLCVHYVSC